MKKRSKGPPLSTPCGPWQSKLQPVQVADGTQMAECSREEPGAVYLAADFQALLADIGLLLDAAENKLGAMQKYHSGPAAQSIEAMRSKLRDGPVAMISK